MPSTLPSSRSAGNGRATSDSLGENPWRRSAPKSLRRQESALSEASWFAWLSWLDERKKPAPLEKLFSSKSWPLRWASVDDSPAVDFVTAMAPAAKNGRTAQRKQTELLAGWLSNADQSPQNARLGIECLAAAHALPRLAQSCDAELWWDVLGRLLTVVKSAADAGAAADPLSAELLTGELPLTLAYLFPELSDCHDLSAAARKNLSEGLVELLDGEGLPRDEHLELLRPLVACWTRSIAMDRAMKGGISNDAAAQFDWLVIQTLRLTRHDGSHAFSTGTADKAELDLIKAAVSLVRDRETRAAAKMTLPGKKSAKQVRAVELPEPANNSEWAAVAVLRPDWSRSSPRLFVGYGGDAMRIELNGPAGNLISGQWDVEVAIDSTMCRPTGGWEELCWHSDDDVDYLELETLLGDKHKLQRQLLYAREDDFLYLADNVLAGGAIEYRGTLPLAPQIEFAAADETREGHLVARRNVAQVLPLALPEWRADPRHGSLVGDRSGLELRQSSAGPNLCCPLFIDLSAGRINRPVTWRQLTVAERLEIQPPHVAAGYRVQCDREQWLFYRSLAERGNRTLLGQNFASDFFAGRLNDGGEAEELIQVE